MLTLLLLKLKFLKLAAIIREKLFYYVLLIKKQTNIFTASLDDKADICVEIPAFHARAGWPLYFYL